MIILLFMKIKVIYSKVKIPQDEDHLSSIQKHRKLIFEDSDGFTLVHLKLFIKIPKDFGKMY